MKEFGAQGDKCLSCFYISFSTFEGEELFEGHYKFRLDVICVFRGSFDSSFLLSFGSSDPHFPDYYLLILYYGEMTHSNFELGLLILLVKVQKLL